MINLLPEKCDQLLDIASGTMDVAISAIKIRPDIKSVIALDMAENMLEIGVKKCQSLDINKIEKKVADIHQLPFQDQSFDAATVSFGIRNFEKLDVAFNETFRVLKSGGNFIILESCQPKSKLLAVLNNIYLKTWVRGMGVLFSGNGDSYGLEVLVKKDEGIWNGWIGYTLSWSNRYFDELNGGEQFYAKYDRRHNFSIVQNVKLSDNWSLGAVWVFSTGSKFTPQIGLYALPNASSTGIEWIPQYAKRNSVSMSPTHRLDLNFVWKTSKKKKFKGEWHFGGYNIYKRASPMRVEVVSDDNGGYKYVQPGLFGFIPSIAYNFEF